MKKKIFSTLLLVAFAWASTSMFVSCKDYDDDINRKADASVVDALQKTVDQLKADLATCKSNCEAAHATFALKTELAKTDENVKNLQEAVKALQDEMKNLVTAQKLEEALAAAQKALNDAIDKKVDKEEFDKLASTVAGLDSKYGELLEKVATIDQKLAAITNLEEQLTILNAYKERVEKLESEMAGKLNEDQVKALIGAALADYATVEALNKLQELVDAKANGADVVELQKLLKELQGKMEEMSGTILTKEQIEQLIATKLIGISGSVDEETIKGFITDALAGYATEDYVDGKIKALEDLLNGVDGEKGLKELMEEANEQVNEFSETINALQFLLDKMITSIVNTNPVMVLGIETVEAAGLAYQPVITVKKIQDETNPKIFWETWYYNDGLGAEYDGAGCPKLVAPTSYKEFIDNPWLVIQEFRDVKHDSYAIEGEAQYHINPNTAKLDDWNLSFYTDERLVVDEVESRTGIKQVFAEPIEKAAAKNTYEGGILTVPFTINDDYTYICPKTGEGHGTFKGWEAYFHKLVCEANVTYAPTIASWPNEGNANDSKGAAVRDNVYFIALQAHNAAKDTTVTSDYAMVAPVIYHVNGIADNTPSNAKPMPKCGGKDGREHHMYKKSKDAADNLETHYIPYNKTTEIFRYVETHFAYIGFNSDYDYNDRVLDPVSWKTKDTNEPVGPYAHKLPFTRDTKTFKKLGLNYRVTPVSWTSGDNLTDETAHITYEIFKDGEVVGNEEAPYIGIPDSIVVSPRSVEAATGKTIKEGNVADNTREIIEREPMLRFEVLDKFNNTIEVGYMKMQISEEEVAPGQVVDPEVTLPIAGPHYYNCEFGGEVTWHQVEGYVLRGEADPELEIGLTRGVALNVKKSEFEQYWALEYNADGTVARYDWTGAEPKPQNPIVGEVVEKYDGLDRETTVLAWSFTAADWAAIAGANGENLVRNADGKLVNKNPIATWVKYKNDGTKFASKGDVYVKLVIPAGSIIFPEGKISNYRYGYWYELNTAISITEENEDKAMDVHMNVRTPANSYDPNVLTTDEFKKDLFEYFTTSDILSIVDAANFAKISKTAGFEFTTPAVAKENAVFDAVNGNWNVLGFSGTAYTLYLSGRGNTAVNAQTNPAVEIRIKNITGNPLVCEILDPADDEEGNTEIVLKYAENDYAWDILNYAHRHALLNGPEDKDKESFTAYIHILADEACIPVTLDKAYFNVKFLRPINWYPQVVDAPIDARTGDHGDGYFYWNLEDFVKFTDWRLVKGDEPNSAKAGWGYPGDAKDYAVVRGYKVNELDDNTLEETTVQTIKNNEITYWKYYGITFESDDTEMYTDVANANRDFVDLNVNEAAKAKLVKVQNLKGMDFQYVPNTTDPTLSRFKYKNNEGTVDNFHVYVPVYITYTYGPKEKNVIKVWGTLSVHKTVHNAAKKN